MQRTLAKLRAGEHTTIVAFGDSNTEITFHTHGRMNWVGLLAEAILETYGHGVCTLVNAGKCGSSYAEGLTRLDRDVLRFAPDLVVLAFGMNDATAGPAGLDAFAANASAMVRRIRDACGSDILIRTPNPVVTVHGLPLPAEQPTPGRPWECAARPLAAYAQALVSLAAEEECALVDHYALWAERRFHVAQPVADPTGLWPRMGDAIHPGELGHLVFFRELAPLFEVPTYFPWEEVETSGRPAAPPR
jgi:lysophospholipase L1-like esterase